MINKKISEIFYELQYKDENQKTTISAILSNFHSRGIALAMIIFSLPLCLPLPYPPGFSTLLGIPLCVLSFQMCFRYDKVVLPKKISNISIKNSILISISKKVSNKLEFVERYVKPRFNFSKSLYCEQLVGLISLINSVIIMLPFPLTNAIPAFGITIMIFGIVNYDGLMIILGIVVSIIGFITGVLSAITSVFVVKYLLKLLFG